MEAREKILDKAIELFLNLGIRNVTMDSIAAESGVSKRTIYELFKDKDDLVVQSLREMIIRHNQDMLGIISEAGNVIEAIFMIMKMEALRRGSFARVFTEDIKKYFPVVNASLYSCKKSLKEFSASFTLLEKGIREGIFRKDMRLDLVDNFLHELIGLIHNSDRLRILQPTGQEVLSNIFLPYFRGICTSEGVALMDKYTENINDYIEL
ncbi:transcriptional regulator, TetR family [Lentimicrobium saccharophilum]|uniref:Transcriptional regulator, TetR family n=1 Tax=Lentimicrobium saccharophilum TaxID=1678841 RepID=A0A0S7C2H1_9BACT|nr:TetR/AcrR family transcriptional regulator [Lentimicrobium saccharophilum]GAP43606.1 transcriptional regulator, TetR family [Lentimicrobium saccharophilum]